MSRKVDPGKRYDAIVVGSGAAGGMAALELVERGAEVLMLEAGPLFPIESFDRHDPVWNQPHRGAIPPRERARYCHAANPWNKRIFVDETLNPYGTAAGTDFTWVRARAVGGKTLVWGLVSLRFAPDDFRRASIDGYGIDWPLTYEDLEPYYRRVETRVGICGNRDRLRNNPDSVFLPAVPMTCGERVLQRGVESLSGRKLIHGRAAVNTVGYGGRRACHYCGHCDRVCGVRASFSSLGVLIPRAERTGRFTLRPGAVVRELLLDEEGDRVAGVRFIDRESRADHTARARVVVLGASTLESTRLLLNSKSERWPDGLGNASGTLGRYYCEHIMAGRISGLVPSLAGTPPVSADARPLGSNPYLPSFRNLGKRREAGFIRGYGFEVAGGGGEFPAYAYALDGLGAAFKAEVRRLYNAGIAMTGFGEVLPRRDNYVEIDPEKVDEWGIPSLRFHVRWGDNEKAMASDMAGTAEEMFLAAGIEISGAGADPRPPGYSIHEAGTCRMGRDRNSSMLNGFNQSHEIANLFVVDGSSFTSATEKNPTLTIMALAARAGDYITEQLRLGTL